MVDYTKSEIQMSAVSDNPTGMQRFSFGGDVREKLMGSELSRL